MTKAELLDEMALLGHSSKHAEQPMQESSWIMYAMVVSLLGSVLCLPGRRCRFVWFRAAPTEVQSNWTAKLQLMEYE